MFVKVSLRLLPHNYTIQPKECGHLTLPKPWALISRCNCFTAIPAFTLWRGFSTRFWRMAADSCVHWATSCLFLPALFTEVMVRGLSRTVLSHQCLYALCTGALLSRRSFRLLVPTKVIVLLQHTKDILDQGWAIRGMKGGVGVGFWDVTV